MCTASFNYENNCTLLILKENPNSERPKKYAKYAHQLNFIFPQKGTK